MFTLTNAGGSKVGLRSFGRDRLRSTGAGRRRLWWLAALRRAPASREEKGSTLLVSWYRKAVCFQS